MHVCFFNTVAESFLETLSMGYSLLFSNYVMSLRRKKDQTYQMSNLQVGFNKIAEVNYISSLNFLLKSIILRILSSPWFVVRSLATFFRSKYILPFCCIFFFSFICFSISSYLSNTY